MSSALRRVTLLLIGSLASSGCSKADRQRAVLPAPVKNAATEAEATPAAPAHKTAKAPSPPAVSSGTVFTGTTEPYRRSTISPKISGKVAQVLVREGQLVKRGQLLVRLDASDIRLRLRAALAAQATAKAKVKMLRREWSRVGSLLKAKAVPRSQFEKLEGQMEVATAGLAQAAVAVAMGKSAVNNTIIRAPYDSLITRVFVSEGVYAAMMPPTPIVTLEQVDKLDLRVQIPETSMRAIKTGERVVIRFGAINKTITLPITRVVKSIQPRTRTFSAIVTIANQAGTLRPGMFAEVRLADSARSAR